MVFDRLAGFIIRRHKLIIIVWIIAFLLALPMAPEINSVLVYDETQMAPDDIESKKAMGFIEAEFGETADSGSTIIVLTSPDILDNNTKSAIYAIQKDLFNATHDGRIDGGVRAESLYTLVTDYAVAVMTEISRGMKETTTLVNLTSNMVFGLPIGFQELYRQVSDAAFILYGMPDTHLMIWQQIRDNHTDLEISEVDKSAYGQSAVSFSLDPTFEGMNHSLQELAWSWFRSYSLAWNVTSGNSTLTSNPPLRAEMVMEIAFPEFLATLPMETRQLFLSLSESLDLITWSGFHLVSALSRSLYVESLSMAAGNSSATLDYFEIFYNIWNSTDAIPSRPEFEWMVGRAVTEYTEQLEEQEAMIVLIVVSGLGLDDWDSPQNQTALARELVSIETESDLWVVQAVTDLGENPSFGQLYDLADAVVRNSTITQFPMLLPEALVDNLVNLPDNDTTLILLTFESEQIAKDSIDPVREIIHQVASSFPMLRSYLTGSDAISVDMSTSTGEDLERIDPVSIILILVLIGVFFRSVVASSIPPLSIGVAIAIAMALVYLIGSYFMSIHYSVLAVMITAMLGAGCDYCIFILSRYHEERMEGRSEEESARASIHWAGEAVTTSGITVMIGFGSLALGDFALMQSMGISLAIGILLALLIALTLLPSILILLKDRLFWPAKPDRGFSKAKKPTRRGKSYFERSARLAVTHAKAIVLAAIIVSVPATYLVLTLDTSYDFIGGMPDTESKQGLEILGEGFGEGRINPTYVVLNFTGPVLDEEFNISVLDQVENISMRLLSLSHVQEVVSPTRPLGQPIDYSNMSAYPIITRSQYEALMRHMIGENGTAVLIEVILESEPFAETSIGLVKQLREMGADEMLNQSSIQAFYVSGSTAIMYDISEMVQEDFGHMRYVVLIGIYVVLLVVLGSVLIPLRLIITILLSISWTIAVTMLVFIHIVGTPILWLMPMVLFVVCMGLGMDYDILLTTRIREEVMKGKGDREAIIHSVEKTGKVITICGLIMAGAFGTMILSSTSLLQEFGFALAFAILLDAIVVRIYLVPAIMVLLEGYNWWAPGRLQRVGRSDKPSRMKAGSRKRR